MDDPGATRDPGPIGIGVNARLNEGAEGVSRLEKVRRIGQSAGPNHYTPRLIILGNPYRRDR